MRTTRRGRIAVASTGMLAVMIAAAGLGLLGSALVPRDGASGSGDGVVEVSEFGIRMESGPIDWAAAAPDPACANCPKRIPGEPCTRTSCDPCCYRCSGDPIPWCY